MSLDSLMSLNLLTLACIILLPTVPAYLLFKALPSSAANVTGPLQGLGLKLSGAFAGYFAVLVLVFSTHNIWAPVPPPLAPPTYQTWEVSGQVTDETGKPIEPLDIKYFDLSPPFFRPSPGGNFTLTFTTMPGPGGRIKYPTLTVAYPEFKPTQIPLDPSASKDLPATLGMDRDNANRIITIRRIALGRFPSPYNPSQTPLKKSHAPYSAAGPVPVLVPAGQEPHQ